ncbi:MAG: SPOR domain-containing protein [Saprospiraceae bacterium]|nr:SPOR domain-containing protein [Saprospiraceae bacterium]
MKVKLFFTLFIILFINVLQALCQHITLNEGKILYQMIETYALNNKTKTMVSGWRVQLLSTTDRRQMDNVNKDVSLRYPMIYTKWEHTEPYYKVVAGAFLNRFDAYHLMSILKKDYPGAYPTKDENIKPHELMGYAK